MNVTIDTRSIEARLRKLAQGMSPAAVDHVVERASLETFAALVRKTPKKWFGQVRRGWVIQKPSLGVRIVVNLHKVMLWLEEGTANAGTGWIYPKVAKALYIPLKRKAAKGWTPDLVYGEDYILRKRVKGIVPRKIVAQERPHAVARMWHHAVDHVRKLLS